MTQLTSMPRGFDAGIINQQWATRPADQRFLSLEELRTFVDGRTQELTEPVARFGQLSTIVAGSGATAHPALMSKRGMPVDFTHHSFGQLCSMIGAPASHLRKRSANLVARYLNECADAAGDGTSKLLLLPPSVNYYVGGNPADVPDYNAGQVRAFTSETYGRIWDLDVVDSVIRVNEDGRWQVPASSYAAHDPKRATTLYAADSNVFIAMVDPEHPIEAGVTADGEPDVMYRGFIAWNSEVGDRTFGLCTFLYRYICDNRLIWGASDVSQLLIRHTKNGPYRFEREAVPVLEQYAESSPLQLQREIMAAKRECLIDGMPGDEGGHTDEFRTWLKTRGFSERAIDYTVDHVIEADQGFTLWETVQGLTAYAHQIAYADARVDLERKASALLEMVRE